MSGKNCSNLLQLPLALSNGDLSMAKASSPIRLQAELMRVIFRDTSFADDVVKTNAVQILKQAGVDDVKSL